MGGERQGGRREWGRGWFRRDCQHHVGGAGGHGRLGRKRRDFRGGERRKHCSTRRACVKGGEGRRTGRGGANTSPLCSGSRSTRGDCMPPGTWGCGGPSRCGRNDAPCLCRDLRARERDRTAGASWSGRKQRGQRRLHADVVRERECPAYIAQTTELCTVAHFLLFRLLVRRNVFWALGRRRTVGPHRAEMSKVVHIAVYLPNFVACGTGGGASC
ncbi:unnamed protein product [Laminaria digitata]